MIECVEQNIYKRKKIKNKSNIRLIIFILFFVLCLLYYRYVIANNIFNVIIHKTNSIIASKVNESILNLSINNDYDFTKIEKNEHGEIVLISLDSFLINQYSRKIVQSVELLVNYEIKKGVEIPLLAFTGIKAFSGYGKTIKYNVLEISTIDCEIKGEFDSVGINQSLHSIYANVKVNLTIDVPFGQHNEIFNTKVLISEKIIIGKIPEIYLNQKG